MFFLKPNGLSDSLMKTCEREIECPFFLSLGDRLSGPLKWTKQGKPNARSGFGQVVLASFRCPGRTHIGISTGPQFRHLRIGTLDSALAAKPPGSKLPIKGTLVHGILSCLDCSSLSRLLLPALVKTLLVPIHSSGSLCKEPCHCLKQPLRGDSSPLTIVTIKWCTQNPR